MLTDAASAACCCTVTPVATAAVATSIITSFRNTVFEVLHKMTRNGFNPLPAAIMIYQQQL
jgi:hypothetical protein